LKIKALRKVHNIFIINLCIHDLLVMNTIPTFIDSQLTGGVTFKIDAYCQGTSLVLAVGCIGSICNISTVAVNRYLAICHTNISRSIFTWKKCAIMIAILWIYAILLVLPTQLGWGSFIFQQKSDVCVFDWTASDSYTIFLGIFAFLVPSNAIMFSYWNIYKTVRASAKAVGAHVVKNKNTKSSQNAGVTNAWTKPAPKKTSRTDIKLAIQLLVLFIIFCVCWTPYLLISLIIDRDALLPKPLYLFAGTLIGMNSVINPPVYLIFNKSLRTELIKCLPSYCQRVITRKSRVNEIQDAPTETVDA
ncbi:unnamed protein product, partial [Owenia fusiformis]